MNTQLHFWVEKNNKGNRTILEIKKEAFLRSIKSKNQNGTNKYKRVVVSPIRYPGGKSLAVGHIVELLPTNITRVISPFFWWRLCRNCN
jgi:hypothetical protein